MVAESQDEGAKLKSNLLKLPYLTLKQSNIYACYCYMYCFVVVPGQEAINFLRKNKALV